MISGDKYASRYSHQMEATVFILPAKYLSTLMNSLAFFLLEIFTLLFGYFRRTKRHFTIHGLVRKVIQTTLET